MEAQIGNIAGLDCAYFLAFGVGLLWAIFVVVTGGLGGDVDVPDADVPGFDWGLSTSLPSAPSLFRPSSPPLAQWASFPGNCSAYRAR
jgi:hypothetical protein